MLEQEQQLQKAFVDRHRCYDETKFQNKKPLLEFQMRTGLMLNKIRLGWVGLYWIIDGKDDIYQLGTLTGGRLMQPVNDFWMRPYYGKMPLNPFLKNLHTDAEELIHVG